MSKKFAMLITLGALAAALGGCAPEPADVCDHLTKVFDGKSSPMGWVKSEDRCISHYEGIQSKHGVNSYRREVECILAASTAYQVRKCIKEEERRRR